MPLRPDSISRRKIKNCVVYFYISLLWKCESGASAVLATGPPEGSVYLTPRTISANSASSSASAVMAAQQERDRGGSLSARKRSDQMYFISARRGRTPLSSVTVGWPSAVQIEGCAFRRRVRSHAPFRNENARVIRNEGSIMFSAAHRAVLGLFGP